MKRLYLQYPYSSGLSNQSSQQSGSQLKSPSPPPRKHHQAATMSIMESPLAPHIEVGQAWRGNEKKIQTHAQVPFVISQEEPASPRRDDRMASGDFLGETILYYFIMIIVGLLISGVLAWVVSLGCKWRKRRANKRVVPHMRNAQQDVELGMYQQ
jgi:hypothetical protein